LRAQVDHQLFLRRVERGLQAVRRVAGIEHAIALAPLRTVSRLTPKRSASSSSLPRAFSIAERIARVVVAILCKSIRINVSEGSTLPQPLVACLVPPAAVADFLADNHPGPDT
jgi:hypothetical protein